MLGIKEQLPLQAPITGNAYGVQDDLPESDQLPGNLRDATRDLTESEAARSIFGDDFIDHFVASRDWEVREYERHVNDWQLKRYFEII